MGLLGTQRAFISQRASNGLSGLHWDKAAEAFAHGGAQLLYSEDQKSIWGVSGSTYFGARSNIGITSGKHSVELLFLTPADLYVSACYMSVGLVTLTGPVDGRGDTGELSSGVCIDTRGGTVFVGGVNTTSYQAFTIDDVLRLDVDRAGGTLMLTKNGLASSGPIDISAYAGQPLKLYYEAAKYGEGAQLRAPASLPTGFAAWPGL